VTLELLVELARELGFRLRVELIDDPER
jgi:hypothetical protein